MHNNGVIARIIPSGSSTLRVIVGTSRSHAWVKVFGNRSMRLVIMSRWCGQIRVHLVEVEFAKIVHVTRA